MVTHRKNSLAAISSGGSFFTLCSIVTHVLLNNAGNYKDGIQLTKKIIQRTVEFGQNFLFVSGEKHPEMTTVIIIFVPILPNEFHSLVHKVRLAIPTRD